MEPSPSLYGDAYRPEEIAARVSGLGVAKVKAPFLTILLLSVLAGAYISMGALFYTVLISGQEEISGLVRFAGGLGFCLGLILVVVGGAELFTGNNLMAMAWATGSISTFDVVRHWTLVYVGNVAGCLGTVLLAAAADTDALLGGQVGETAIAIAETKTALPAFIALIRGILCNALVCLAVWLAMGGRTVTDKILAILLPISAFVAMGFEHSVANWFFLPYAMALAPSGIISGQSAWLNLLWVTAGNLLGGTLLVAGVYWLAYLRKESGHAADARKDKA